MSQNPDEQKRFLLALTLSLGLLMAFQYFILPSGNQKKKNGRNSSASRKSEKGTGEDTVQNRSTDDTSGQKSTQGTSGEPGTRKGTTDTSDRGPTPSTPTGDPQSGSDDESSADSSSSIGAPQPSEAKTIELESEEIKATFSSRGGKLTSIVLKNYYRTAKKEETLQLFDDRFRKTPSFDIKINDEDAEDLNLNRVNWHVSSRPTDRQPDRPLVFEHQTKDGMLIRKTFQLNPDKPFLLNYDVSFRGEDQSVETGQLKLYGPSGIVLQSKQDQGYHQGVYAYRTEGEWVFENGITPSYLKDEEPQYHDVRGPCWTGVTNKYFASTLIPTTNRKKLLGYSFERLTMPGADKGNRKSVKSEKEILHPLSSVTSYFVTEKLELDPDEATSYSFNVYAGPKKESVLNDYADYGLPNLINYVMFIGFLSEIFISVLGFLYGIIGNYGVAILLLTLLVKLCLHPITKKAQISMHKMKDLQPKIEKLQEKYEDDRQKLGEEQMKLFKEHGVNPLGGCLPMLFQIPVLIGLYYGIRVSFEVRQKPFLLWINDLSQPDHFMEIGLGSFFGIDLQYLNLLIILMMATWLLQALTQPTPDTGGQGGMQNAMKFMPMIFGVICYNFASGLILYWMMSTLFSALEQIYIRQIVLPSMSS